MQMRGSVRGNWLRNSITRYLRYWIIRLVYEQREQTDQLIRALRDEK